MNGYHATEFIFDEAENTDPTVFDAINKRLRDQPSAFIVKFRPIKNDRSSRGKGNRARLRTMRRFFQYIYNANAEEISAKIRTAGIEELLYGRKFKP